MLYAFASKIEKQGAPADVVRSYLTEIVAQPVREALKPFERDLVELIASMNKQLKPLVYIGGEVPILTLPMQDFLFAITHIARNIADHGIESSSLRLSNAKDPMGTVTIKAEVLTDAKMGEILSLSIGDDGAGIDPKRVREKLSLIDPEGTWVNESDQQIVRHIFTMGFSTKESVTDISGRGVGMDAVEFEVKKLGGTIDVETKLGEGTRFVMKIPYGMNLSFLSAKQGCEAAYGRPLVEQDR
jgi:two-component system chemotaxis sensor kinase CheA